ncbi:MAG: hypothetical protein U0744_18545 [Gemmataceae bacterium]
MRFVENWYYGKDDPLLKKAIAPVTGQTGKLRDLCKADGIKDEDILNIPDDVGGRAIPCSHLVDCSPR